ncbi:TRAP transporter large permease subunit [Desulfoscipio geothermicus]|uniref:TRAP-type C4-dicarboxylate transport system, large permease component n=1 Tax=Desulfoscipio geothermicus DSM 3669 TaxID=1121426 RepID=A0A1I6EK34_9FIRM|nr:TRAP transporter large permease subunit [Desulfoscipio geothermicus]SFR18136.1 TRAP-type C4-dicarboxylate transport system, large permease component [Desulfoscipio geothermicus DSM 3669]
MYIMGIPQEVFYLIELLIFIVILFMVFKRPIYEAIALGFPFTIIMTQRYDLFWEYLIYPTKSSLFYIIVTFLVLAHILNLTKVVEKLINLIIAIFGRFPGGAGYVSLFGSSAMAMMSGTGPGNVAATGVFTIPAMIKTGYPRELAATTEMSCSTLGNQMGPGLNLVGFGILASLYPDKYSLSAFWLALWVVGGWLIIQRMAFLYGFAKYYNIKPIPKEERPGFSQSLKEGWKALLIPILILLPLLIDSTMKPFVISRLGEAGQQAFSGTLLMFVAGVACVYALYIGRDNIPGGFNASSIAQLFKNTLKGVVPVSATIYFAYAISVVFKQIEMQDAVQQWFLSFGVGQLGWAILVVLFTAFLGMILPGSAQVAILGGAIISTGAAVGLDPFVVAAVMPAITGCMEGMTPPMALCMYAAMGIAKSGFKETAKLAYIWIFGHMVMAVILLLGLLPLFVH